MPAHMIDMACISVVAMLMCMFIAMHCACHFLLSKHDAQCDPSACEAHWWLR